MDASNVVTIGVKLDTRDAKRSAEAIKRALKEMGVAATVSGGKMAKGAKQGSAAMDRTRKSVLSLKQALVGLGIGAGMVALTKGVLNAGMSFEQSMTQVGGIMQATDAEFKMLKDTAREMGETTEWSATQAAQGLKFLGMAGFTATQATKALPGVLDLATAGGLELSRAADIASNALSAMGLDVEELSRVNDVFVRAITGSNVSMEQLAESFKFAAPTGHAFGYTLEEITAMLGVLGNAGIQGSMAGTNLSRAFMNTAKVFEHYGVSAKNADGSTKKLTDAVKLLKERGADTATVLDLLGNYGGRVALIMMENEEAFRKLHERMFDMSITTEKMAETFRNTVAGAFKELKSVIESLFIDIFEEHKESIQQFIKDLAQAIRDNKPEIIEFFKGLGDLMLIIAKRGPEALNAVVGFFSGITAAWNSVPDLLKNVIIGGLVGGYIGGKFGVPGAGMGIGALLGAGYTGYKTWDDVMKDYWKLQHPWGAPTGKTEEIVKKSEDLAARERMIREGKILDLAKTAVETGKEHIKATDDLGGYLKQQSQMLLGQLSPKAIAEKAGAPKGTLAEKSLEVSVELPEELKKIMEVKVPEIQKGTPLKKGSGVVGTGGGGVGGGGGGGGQSQAARDAERELDRLRQLKRDFEMERAKLSKDAFAEEWLQYERDAQKWKELLDNKMITQQEYDAWRDSARAEIEAKEAEHYKKLEEQQREAMVRQQVKAYENYKRQLEMSDDFVDGIRLGMLRIQEESETGAEAVAGFMQEAHDSISGALSDVLFAAITGKIEDIETAIKRLGESILRAFTDRLAKALTDDLFGALFGTVPGGVGGARGGYGGVGVNIGSLFSGAGTGVFSGGARVSGTGGGGGNLFGGLGSLFGGGMGGGGLSKYGFSPSYSGMNMFAGGANIGGGSGGGAFPYSGGGLFGGGGSMGGGGLFNSLFGGGGNGLFGGGGWEWWGGAKSLFGSTPVDWFGDFFGGISDFFSSLWGGFTSLFGFASGGMVYRDNPIIVGERGPEIFVPDSDGQILPHYRLREMQEGQKALFESMNKMLPDATAAPTKRIFGGPVEEETPYMVGESGYELFWPDSSGSLSTELSASLNPLSSNEDVGLDPTKNKISEDDLLSKVAAAVRGANIPRRAEGGPINKYLPYWVGEIGPEIFFPYPWDRRSRDGSPFGWLLNYIIPPRVTPRIAEDNKFFNSISPEIRDTIIEKNPILGAMLEPRSVFAALSQTDWVKKIHGSNTALGKLLRNASEEDPQIEALKEKNPMFAAFADSARALGGSVYEETAYLVGERGPELFVPDSDGMVIPNHKLSRGIGTQGSTEKKEPEGKTNENNYTTQVTMHISTPDADSFRRSEGQILAQISSVMNRATRRNK